MFWYWGPILSAHLQLESELIQHVRSGNPTTVGPATTVRAALDLMKAERDGSMLIANGDQLLGIFTERDALKILAAGGDMNVAIETVMTTDPTTLQDTDTVAMAVKKMSSGGYRRIPILDQDGKLAGIIKVSHILRYLVEHVPEIVYNLPPTPHHTTQQREGA